MFGVNTHYPPVSSCSTFPGAKLPRRGILISRFVEFGRPDHYLQHPVKRGYQLYGLYLATRQDLDWQTSR